VRDTADCDTPASRATSIEDTYRFSANRLCLSDNFPFL
jgi:hypothetical protein